MNLIDINLLIHKRGEGFIIKQIFEIVTVFIKNLLGMNLKDISYYTKKILN